MSVVCVDNPHSPYRGFRALLPEGLLDLCSRFLFDEVKGYERPELGVARYVTTAVWLFRTDKTGAPCSLSSNFFDMKGHLYDYYCQRLGLPKEEDWKYISHDLQNGVMSSLAEAYPHISSAEGRKCCTLLVHVTVRSGMLSLEPHLIKDERSREDEIFYRQRLFESCFQFFWTKSQCQVEAIRAELQKMPIDRAILQRLCELIDEEVPWRYREVVQLLAARKKRGTRKYN